MSGVTLWLIRHGESTSNRGEWSSDPHQAPLTVQGEEQAQLAAEQVTHMPDLIVVSPALRAQQSALPIIARWPACTVETWPIQEFVYLSPTNYRYKTPEERRVAKERYWSQAEPAYCDGTDAESFAHFMRRLNTFHEQILTRAGFIVVVGHGQFFKAYQLGLREGFACTSAWMQHYRHIETSNPISNGEIVKLEC